MKIGILTYHRVVNDGSTMQAYCLYRLLSRTFPGAQVEIIDYWGAGLQRREWLRAIGKKPPFLKVDRLRKAASQLRFLRQHCRLSEESCMTDDLGKARRFLERQNYDAIFVGSDTVWEVRQNGGGPFPPNLFFLPDIQGPKKISFAASSSKTDEDALSRPGLRESLRRNIEAFDEITCRDEGTISFVQQLGVDATRIRFMPDPTLVGDFPSCGEAEAVLPCAARPVAGLAVGNPSLRARLAQRLLALGYEVVSFLGAAPEHCRPLPVNLDILKRVYAHREVTVFVTDRFHGSIFTFVQNDAPVVLIEERALYPDGVWKGRDLYRRLGIEGMIWPLFPEGEDGDGLTPRLEQWAQLHSIMKERLAGLKTEGLAELEAMGLRQVLGSSPHLSGHQ